MPLGDGRRANPGPRPPPRRRRLPAQALPPGGDRRPHRGDGRPPRHGAAGTCRSSRRSRCPTCCRCSRARRRPASSRSRPRAARARCASPAGRPAAPTFRRPHRQRGGAGSPRAARGSFRLLPELGARDDAVLELPPLTSLLFVSAWIEDEVRRHGGALPAEDRGTSRGARRRRPRRPRRPARAAARRGPRPARQAARHHARRAGGAAPGLSGAGAGWRWRCSRSRLSSSARCGQNR